MDQPVSSLADARKIDPPSTTTVSLRGPWLTLARVGWLALVALCLLLAGVALPQYTAQLSTVCAGAACPGTELSPDVLRTLQQAGLSIDSYAALTLSMTLLSSLVWCAIGCFLFWRKSDDWFIWLASLQAVMQGSVGSDLTGSLHAGGSFWWLPYTILSYLSTVLILPIFALFPNGRFAPRWMRWLVLCFSALSALPVLVPDNPIIGSLGGVFFFVPAVCLIGGQIYRYRRVSTPVQRQQTKWVVLGMTTVILIQIVTVIPAFLVSSFGQPGSLYEIVGGAIDNLALLLIPIGIAISLLRYRLWDIDALINKALVYGTLTGLLAALYAGLIIGLTSLMGLVSGADDQPIVLVISTLVIAALFQPVRRRLQSAIDRRFYRSKYDAERTLSAFSAILRNEVDLNDLRAQLSAVVQETMQPAHLSLWLRSPQRPAEAVAQRLESGSQGPG